MLVRNPPQSLPEVLEAYAKSRLRQDLDVVLLFAKSTADFKGEFEPLIKSIKAAGMIWVAWPKRTSGIKTDLNENVIRDHALKTSLVDVKVCAIDQIWSGLKLVIRKDRRADHATRTK